MEKGNRQSKNCGTQDRPANHEQEQKTMVVGYIGVGGAEERR
jgi:hypothetical protein